MPAAKALAASDLTSFRAADVLAAHTNALAGATACLVLAKKIAQDLPSYPMDELRTIANLGLAVIFAASEVDRLGGSDGSTKKLVVEAHGLHDLLLTSARALAKAGRLSEAAVAAIGHGHGSLAVARDLVALGTSSRTTPPRSPAPRP